MLDRIQLLLKIKNLSSSQFADEIGVQRSNISHIISGRNNPSLEFMIKILNRYPEIQTDWLLFGTGPMYKDAGLNENLTSGTEHEQSLKLSSEPDLFSIENNPKAEELEPPKEEAKKTLISDKEIVFEQTSSDYPQRKMEEIKEKQQDSSEPTEKGQPIPKAIKRIILLFEDGSFETYNQ